MNLAGPFELGELPTLIIGIAALLLGQYIRRTAPLLKRIDIPDAVVGASNFGLIQTSYDPRQVQLALRYGF